MKINTLNSNGISSVKRAPGGPEARTSVRESSRASSGADRVTISDEARFLQELRDAAGGLGDIRPDVVEAARADLEAGRIGTEEDYQRAIEALFMEL